MAYFYLATVLHNFQVAKRLLALLLWIYFDSITLRGLIEEPHAKICSYENVQALNVYPTQEEAAGTLLK